MIKVDVVHILKSKNSVILVDEIRKDIVKKFEYTISRVNSKETELKIFFKKPVSLHAINKFFELRVSVKEIHWRHEKKIGNGTSILEMLIE